MQEVKRCEVYHSYIAPERGRVFTDCGSNLRSSCSLDVGFAAFIVHFTALTPDVYRCPPDPPLSPLASSPHTPHPFPPSLPALLPPLACGSVCRSVGRSVGRSVHPSVGRSVHRLVGPPMFLLFFGFPSGERGTVGLFDRGAGHRGHRQARATDSQRLARAEQRPSSHRPGMLLLRVSSRVFAGFAGVGSLAVFFVSFAGFADLRFSRVWRVLRLFLVSQVFAFFFFFALFAG